MNSITETGDTAGRVRKRAVPTETGDGEDDLDTMFSSGAWRYDLMSALNPGYRRHLGAAATELITRVRRGAAGARLRLLDLGCGSGASTAELVRRADQARVTGVDASSGMLAAARRKRWPLGTSFVRRHAEDLPGLGLPPQDGILAAYLLRNVPVEDRDRLCQVMHDQLRPGGWLVLEEYGLATARARTVWHLVCRFIIIPLSRLIVGDTSLYLYLWRSVVEFESRQRVMQRLVEAGFSDVAVRTVPGWQQGLLHIYVARRPA